MSKLNFLKICLVFLLIQNIYTHDSEEEISQSVDEKVITCGSALRIQNVMTKFK